MRVVDARSLHVACLPSARDRLWRSCVRVVVVFHTVEPRFFLDDWYTHLRVSFGIPCPKPNHLHPPTFSSPHPSFDRERPLNPSGRRDPWTTIRSPVSFTNGPFSNEGRVDTVPAPNANETNLPSSTRPASSTSCVTKT